MEELRTPSHRRNTWHSVGIGPRWRRRGLGTTLVLMIASKSILVVYHSMTGGTLQMASAAAVGAAAVREVKISVCNAAQTGIEQLLAADAYVFASPESLAAMSGMMKDFFDRTYYAAVGSIEGRAYATLVCAGSDGQNAARQIERIAVGWRLRRIAPALIICTHSQTAAAILAPNVIAAEDLLRCEELGRTLAEGLAWGIY